MCAPWSCSRTDERPEGLPFEVHLRHEVVPDEPAPEDLASMARRRGTSPA